MLHALNYLFVWWLVCGGWLDQISGKFVDIHGLYDAAGDEIAKLCRAPPGYTAHVVCGAAAGLAHATAACITGGDHEKVRALPDTSGIARRIVLLDEDGDDRWDAAIKLTGAVVRRVGVSDRAKLRCECARADVACFIWFDGYNDRATAPSVSELVAITREARSDDPVPVVVDAASRLPPVSNLWTIVGAGAACVIFSGGKAIRGPQTSGFLLGRRELISNARANGSPNEASVCRPMKTSKETVVGLVAALSGFVQSELAMADSGGYSAQLARPVIEALVDGLTRPAPVRGLELKILSEGPWSDVQPRAHPHLAARFTFGERDLAPGASAELEQHRAAKSSNADLYGDGNDHGNPLKVVPNSVVNLVAARLARGSPKVAVNTTADGIVFNPYTMTVDDADITAHRLREVLEKVLRPPGAKL